MEWGERPSWSGRRVAAAMAEKASEGQRCVGGACSGRCEMGNRVSIYFIYLFLRTLYLCSRPLLNIKSTNEFSHIELLSLML
jgi:hypothetical protein